MDATRNFPATEPKRRSPQSAEPLPTVAVGITECRREAGVQVVKPLRYFGQAVLDDGKAGGHVVVRPDGRFSQAGRPAAGEHGGQMARVPVKCERERFEGPGAASALHSVVLNLADDGLRDVR